MDTLQIQDVFEPYYDGRKDALAGVDPAAADKARQAKDRIEQARKAKRGATERAA